MREQHTFVFSASDISEAAGRKAQYHEDRAEHWEQEYEAATARVEGTIGAKLVRQAMTDGYQVSVVVDYGDKDAYDRMQQAFRKLANHKEDAESYRSDEYVYGTQANRSYELSAQDVQHYGLNRALAASGKRQWDGEIYT